MENEDEALREVELEEATTQELIAAINEVGIYDERIELLRDTVLMMGGQIENGEDVCMAISDDGEAMDVMRGFMILVSQLDALVRTFDHTCLELHGIGYQQMLDVISASADSGYPMADIIDKFQSRRTPDVGFTESGAATPSEEELSRMVHSVDTDDLN